MNEYKLCPICGGPGFHIGVVNRVGCADDDCLLGNVTFHPDRWNATRPVIDKLAELLQRISDSIHEHDGFVGSGVDKKISRDIRPLVHEIDTSLSMAGHPNNGERV